MGMFISVFPYKNSLLFRMTPARHLRGFSLGEVMVATLILSIGVSAAVASLNTSLRTTQKAQDGGSLATVAQSEMERQRSLPIPVAVPATSEAGITRTVAVRGCNFTDTDLTCLPSVSCTAANPACQIIVTVTADGTADSLEIDTIKAIAR